MPKVATIAAAAIAAGSAINVETIESTEKDGPNDLNACRCTASTAFTIASSAHGSLFDPFGASAGSPSSAGWLKHFASCFVGTKCAACSTAFNFEPGRVAIPCFGMVDCAEPTVTLSSVLHRLHSIGCFLGFEPYFGYLRPPYSFLLYRAFNNFNY